MADASATAFEGLPPPDYAETPDFDPTLQVPAIIHYDEWRSSTGGDDNEYFPAPPAELLVEDDEAFPEPPPDYDYGKEDDAKYPGLIPPHKLPNPVLESKDRVRLNKDIQFNAKHGINVLDTKPELQKELQRRKLEKQKKEFAEQQRNNRNSFEQKLDERKEKLAVQEREANIVEEQEEKQSELARIHNRIKAKSTEPL